MSRLDDKSVSSRAPQIESGADLEAWVLGTNRVMRQVSEHAQRVAEAARKKGADEAEVYGSYGQVVAVAFEKGEVVLRDESFNFCDLVPVAEN